MNKSNLSAGDIRDFVDSVEAQYGVLIAKDCRREINNTTPDQEVNVARIVRKALKNNPEVERRIANGLKPFGLRFHS